MKNCSFCTGKIVFWHLDFEECYTMHSYNHIFIMHVPRGTLTLMQSLKKLPVMQNKCIRFYLKLDKMHHISEEDFKTNNCSNWLPIYWSKSTA